MPYENIDKKLREVRFLDKMRETEKLAFGDKEHSNFYLSAFFNAAISTLKWSGRGPTPPSGSS
jgi:hypothetical protein